MEGCVGLQQGCQRGAQQHRDVEQDAHRPKQPAQEGPVVVKSYAAAISDGLESGCRCCRLHSACCVVALSFGTANINPLLIPSTLPLPSRLGIEMEKDSF